MTDDRDRVQWTVKMRGLGDHLTEATMPAAAAGTTPEQLEKLEQRWTAGQIAVSQLFMSTIPDSVFHRIKSATTVKDVWDALKTLYEKTSRVWLVDAFTSRSSLT